MGTVTRRSFMASIAALLLHGCDASPELELLDLDATILAFGDSLTEGYGAPEGQSYPEILESLIGRRVINAGISGEESDSGLARLPEVLAETQPDIVILCHGGNDILRNRDPSTMESNLRRMISLAENHGAKVILLGVPDANLLLQPADAYDAIAESTNIVYVDDAISEVLRSADL